MNKETSKMAILESKLRKVEDSFLTKKKERISETEKLQKIQERGVELTKRIKKLSTRTDFLKKKVDFFSNKENVFKAQKRTIEEQEKKENNAVKKRRIERERWGIEEKRRRVEEKKWGVEDVVKKLNREIRDIEQELDREVKAQEKKIILRIKNIDNAIEKHNSWKEFLEKEIINAKKERKQKNKEEAQEREIVERIRSDARKREEEIKREQEKQRLLEKKREKQTRKTEPQEENAEEEIVERIRSDARKREEEIKKKNEEKEEERKKETEEKFKELLEVIAENREEIKSLKKDLSEKFEKNISTEGSLSNDQENQINIIRKRIEEEKERLEARERMLREERNFINSPYKSEQPRKEEFLKEDASQERDHSWDNFQKPPSQPRVEQPFRQQEKASLSENSEQKLTHSEAEALFKKAEKSFYAGSMQIAKARFQRIVDNYYPEEQKGILGKMGKSLDVRAGEYINKIDRERDKQQGVQLSGDKKESLMQNLYQERKTVESEIQEVLAERKKIEEEIKNAEEKEDLQEVARFSHQFEEIEAKRSALERSLGENIEKTENLKENPYTNPTVVREIIREKVQEAPRESIKEEIKKILAEKEAIEKEIEIAAKKKAEEEKRAEEIKKREEELKKEKNELEKRESITDSEEEKEEIRKRKEEMEKELRRIIAEETTEKWEKRMREVENEVMRVNRKYEELTKKEEALRYKVKEISSWGPESRKKEKEFDTYRSLYGKSFGKIEEKEIIPEDDKKKKGKASPKPSSDNFFKSLKPSKDFFLKPPLLIAVDISDYSLEVFAINEQKVVTSFGRTLLEEGTVYNGEIREEAKLKEKITEVFKNAKPFPIIKKDDRRIKGAINLPESKVFVQQVKVKKEEDVLTKIKSEIERTIPISIDDLYFHYHEIPLPQKEEKIMLCVAVEKRIVKQYISFLRAVDVDPIIFDLEAASLGRCLLSVKKEKKEGEVIKSEMIIDIGARSSNVSVFYDQVLSFSVSIPFGGAYFTEKITKKLNISIEEAEKRKKRIGLRGELRDVLAESLEKIAKEIRDVEKYYSREIGGEIGNMIVVGGSSLVPGVLDYFKSEFGDVVSAGEPSGKIKKVKELDEKEILIYANVIGLALRIIEKDPIEKGLNVLPDEIKKTEKRYQQERRRWVWISAILFALIGAAALFFSIYYAYGFPF